jgi:hypothetical protein
MYFPPGYAQITRKRQRKGNSIPDLNLLPQSLNSQIQNLKAMKARLLLVEPVLHIQIHTTRSFISKTKLFELVSSQTYWIVG